MYYSDDIEKVEGGSNTAVTFKVFHVCVCITSHINDSGEISKHSI